MQKYFLYARKSTDVEDKQILSIEAQITELRAFAKKEKLHIVKTIIEKRTAKTPGRPLFNQMLDQIEKGEADGIISWHPDRLARNSVDGGKVIYLLDIGKLKMLKFNTFWFDNTPQGKFMLNMAFGQSKYYVDNLSENTKRGLRQKVRNGIYPSLAPIGYLNDVKKKTIIVDKKKAHLIKEAYELYAEGNSRLEDMSSFLAKNGIFSRNGKPLKRDRITFTLSNPIYYGHFRFGKEIYAGKHTPIISKKLFDQVQAILKQRGRPHHHAKNEPQAFCGLVQCATCNMMVTGEVKVKTQQNGNVHQYVYYRCTRKNKNVRCEEPCVRQEVLDTQLSLMLEKFSLPEDWAKQFRAMLEKDEKEDNLSADTFIQETRQRAQAVTNKLQKLLDSYLEGDIEKEVYRDKKAEIMSEKKTVEEKVINFEEQQIGWIEPMGEWINEAQLGAKIAQNKNLLEKKVFGKKLFGSNLQLRARTLSVVPTIGELDFGLFQPSVDRETEFSPNWITGKNAWDKLVSARQLVGRFDDCLLLVARRGIGPLLPG